MGGERGGHTVAPGPGHERLGLAVARNVPGDGQRLLLPSRKRTRIRSRQPGDPGETDLPELPGAGRVPRSRPGRARALRGVGRAFRGRARGHDPRPRPHHPGSEQTHNPAEGLEHRPQPPNVANEPGGVGYARSAHDRRSQVARIGADVIRTAAALAKLFGTPISAATIATATGRAADGLDEFLTHVTDRITRTGSEVPVLGRIARAIDAALNNDFRWRRVPTWPEERHSLGSTLVR
jgi:hypothetical protein